MARVVLIGGHGKVALLAATKLIEAGHEVTSVFRNPDHTDEVAATGATARVGDVETMDVAALENLMTGHDAVVWSAGAGGGDSSRTYAVDRDAAIRSMDAAEQAGARRYVMVSYFGAGPEHGIPEDDSFFPYADAKAAADTHLRGTDLDWTILMPGKLTLDPSPGALAPDPAESGPTSRELVAEVITAAVIADPAAVARTNVAFIDGDVPVADALRDLRSQ